MNILISNDDGWQAPGIVALADAVQSFGSIKVVAPDRNRSAASNSLTLMHPIRATLQRPDWYSVDGTPADCVNVALNGLLDWKPDLVVSGDGGVFPRNSRYRVLFGRLPGSLRSSRTGVARHH